MGCVRIGTLHDFRSAEHAQGIRDSREGTKRVIHRGGPLHIEDTNNISPELAASKDYQAIGAFESIKLTNCTNVRIDNLTLSRNIGASDCFVYCLSETNAPNRHLEFEGADSCLRIDNQTVFFSTLTESLNAVIRVSFKGVHKVQYTERNEAWNGQDWGKHPALMKEPQFANQCELRAIWTPTVEKIIQPMVTGNHRLISHCTVV